MLGVEAAGTEGVDGVFVDHLADGFLRDFLDLLDFVGGAEAVEEVDEGDLGLEGGGVGHEGHVGALLDAVGAEEGEAGLTAGHDVAVVAEDGETLHGEGAGGHVEDSRGELAGDLVHVRDHQQQALGGREGGGERAGGQRAVDRARGAAFGLELNDLRDGAPDVGLLVGGPLVGEFGHGRGGRDRVDGGDLGARERDARGGLVAVTHDEL